MYTIKDKLEQELKKCYGDSTLRVVSCDNPKYYGDRTVSLHIEVNVLPAGFNACVIYFIHHKNKDLQFSFMFSKAATARSMDYIDKVMKTLKLL